MVDVNVGKMVKEKKRKAINILKNKIKFISKMAKMQRILREESENIIKIKVVWLVDVREQAAKGTLVGRKAGDRGL